MKRIIALAWLNVLQLLRNPTELVALIALPLALTLVFGASTSGDSRKQLWLPVVDDDGGAYAKQVVALLKAEPSFNVELMSRDSAETAVSDQKAGLAVFIPEGFDAAVKSGKAEIQTLSFEGSNDALAISAVVQGIAVRMSTDAHTARTLGALSPASSFGALYNATDALWEPRPPVSVEGETVIASEVRGEGVQATGTTQSSAGFTVFFLMFATFGSAGAMLEEREQGTLRRLLVTPARKSTLLSGKILGIVLAAVLQVLVLTTVGALAFGVPWANQPVASAMVLLSYILAITGLAVLVSTIVRTRSQFSGAAPIFSTGLAMLGGSFWPLDIVSPFMQTVAKFTPSGWAMIGLTDILARNQGVAAAITPSLVLLAFAAVTLGIGVKMLKFE